MNEVPDPIAGALRALDQDAGRAAARVDPARVAERVMARLREEPVGTAGPASARGNGAMLRIAAAVLVLVIGGAVVRQVVVKRPAGGADLAALPVSFGSDTLSTGQADLLLAAVDDARAARLDSSAANSVALSVDDLNETELRTLLQTMELKEDTK